MLSNNDSEDNWTTIDLMNFPAKEVMDKFCHAAPFGDLKQQKTVYDPNVRLASECDASKFRFKSYEQTNEKDQKNEKDEEEVEKVTKPRSKKRVHGTVSSESAAKKRKIEKEDKKPTLTETENPSFLNTIRILIEENLISHSIELIPYKLNIYGPGGFFKPHVDTPTNAEKMIGTLVLCLPCKFKGGELVLTHKSSTQTFDFSQLSVDTSKIQWAAFYSDCVHEVKPTKEGFRVTLTYSIMVPDKKKKKLIDDETITNNYIQFQSHPALDKVMKCIEKKLIRLKLVFFSHIVIQKQDLLLIT